MKPEVVNLNHNNVWLGESELRENAPPNGSPTGRLMKENLPYFPHYTAHTKALIQGSL